MAKKKDNEEAGAESEAESNAQENNENGAGNQNLAKSTSVKDEAGEPIDFVQLGLEERVARIETWIKSVQGRPG
jgi:hypothetical protein